MAASPSDAAFRGRLDGGRFKIFRQKSWRIRQALWRRTHDRSSPYFSLATIPSPKGEGLNPISLGYARDQFCFAELSGAFILSEAAAEERR